MSWLAGFDALFAASRWCGGHELERVPQEETPDAVQGAV